MAKESPTAEGTADSHPQANSRNQPPPPIATLRSLPTTKGTPTGVPFVVNLEAISAESIVAMSAP